MVIHFHFVNLIWMEKIVLSNTHTKNAIQRFCLGDNIYFDTHS